MCARWWDRRIGRRRALTAAAVGGGAAVLAACGGASQGGNGGQPRGAAQPSSDQPRAGGVINQRLPTDPPSMDLHQVTTFVGVWPTIPCFNQLVQFDSSRPTAGPNDIQPDLAERWEQPDAQTVVFHLRRGVTWHDGTSFTAEDPRAQLDWMRNPPQGKVSPRRAAFGTVAAIETPDPHTFVLRLTQPTPSLMMNLANHYAAIGQAADLAANGEVSARLIGTGPFKLKQYQRSNLIELEKNPAYHIPGRPYLDGLRFFILPDSTTAQTNFLAGQYQMYYDGFFRKKDAEDAKLQLGNRLDVDFVPSTIRDPVFMNARRRPYDDLRVRQAISLMIDRDAAIRVVREGGGSRGGYMNPKGPWAIPDADLRRFDGYDKPDLQKARQLLQAAGVTTPLQAATTTRTDFKDFAEFVQDQLRRGGIELAVTLADTASAQPVMQRGDYDIGPWTISINTDDPDATFSEIATSRAVRNWSAVFDPQIDALYERQSQTMNFEERKKIVNDLERQALGQYQVAVLYFSELVFAKYATVRNMVYQESIITNRRMENVWLAQ
jgi:peptide/nickel transport system substrate-binding protein